MNSVLLFAPLGSQIETHLLVNMGCFVIDRTMENHHIETTFAQRHCPATSCAAWQKACDCGGVRRKILGQCWINDENDA